MGTVFLRHIDGRGRRVRLLLMSLREQWDRDGSMVALPLVLLSVFLGWFLGKWIIPHAKYSLLDLIILQKIT